MTSMGQLCQKEKGLGKQREGQRSKAAEESGQRVLEGLPRGTAGSGGATEVAEAGFHLVRSMCTGMPVET